MTAAPTTNRIGGETHARAVLRAFTMIEMVVVISVILIILSLVLPAAGSLWSQRKAAQAESTIQGMLMSTRADAIESGVEKGFLAFVDEQGNQRLIGMERIDLTGLCSTTRSPCDKNAPCPAGQTCDPIPLTRRQALPPFFRINADRFETLPQPFRIVPRYAVDQPPSTGDSPDTFSDVELIDDDYLKPEQDVAPGQRQRNFFTILFSPEGRLLKQRDVLLIEKDEDDDQRGDFTHLPLTDKDTASTTFVTNAGPAQPILASDKNFAIGGTVAKDPVNGDEAALNFPSVGGLIVYDDKAFRDFDQDQVRDFLIRTGQPLYVSRLTGSVIRGPIGEVAQTP